MVPLEPLPSRPSIILFFLSGVVLFFLARFYVNYRNVVKTLRARPDIYTFFPLHGLVSNITRYVPGVALGRNWAMRLKYQQLFAEKGRDVVTILGLYPSPSIGIIVADPLAIKEITMSRARFPKPTESYGVLALFGQNIVVTEGDEWKLHRRVTAPVFSEKNNRLVWDESVRIALDTFESWGPQNSEVVINHAADISISVALVTICIAGFGRRITFNEDKQIPAGHRLSFIDAVHTVSAHVHIKIIAPKFAIRFSKFLTHVELAFEELEQYMQEMREERKSSVVKEERYDLFSALLEAAEGEDAATLTPRDVIGNIFIFLIAGHETTAHTLCFCMGLLALEQDVQERLFRHIIVTLGNREIPTYEQMNALSYVLATFYETMRLFPPVANIPKVCAEDATIPTTASDGFKTTVFIPRGARIHIDVPALHFNPQYWPDPEAFRPERFLGDWPRDAFVPFSAGPRACLGRKFAETEVVAFLTMLISRYKIELRDPEAYEGLTHAEKRAKLLANRAGLTVTPISVPLIFTKR